MFLCKLLQMKLAYEEHIVVDKFKERFRIFFFLGKVQMILLIVLDTDEMRRIMLLLLLFK